jgi:predicted dehydrogenase
MRFALLGDHPDGLDMARALVASGRHELAAYAGPPEGAKLLQRWAIAPMLIPDIEEILADPNIQAVIVASRLADRPLHLRRALQSERHVFCVHPVDETPDAAYEAALIQGDTGRVLLPLLPEALHPAFTRLAGLIQTEQGPLGAFQFLEMERNSADAILVENGARGQRSSLRGWDVLRNLGGDVVEVLAFGAGQVPNADEPLLVAGRFDGQELFQVTFLPGRNPAKWQLTVAGSYGQADLSFPEGWPGPSCLVWRNGAGEVREERWDSWNPWPALVDVFERALEGSLERTGSSRRQDGPTPLTWQTAVRCLELDDAARRSIERRRVTTLEYPEATEEVGFKGTMTLVGCALLWVSLLLLILSAWISWFKWLIVPLLIGFLAMQLLRWIVPGQREHEGQDVREGR